MIAPPPPPTQAKSTDTNNSDADSDSDWDDDDDFVKKINIKIKPVAQLTPSKISASVDELRATVGTWKSMANINLVKPNSRRSHHQSTLQLDKINSLAQINQQYATNNYDQTPTIPITAAAAGITTNTTTTIPPTTSTPIIQNDSLLTDTLKTNDDFNLPVAFAIQECLNVRTTMPSGGGGSTNLNGRVKMAVPKSITSMGYNLSKYGSELEVNIVHLKEWNTIRLNDQFVRELKPTDSEEQTNIDNYPKINGYNRLDDDWITKPTSINNNLSNNDNHNYNTRLLIDMKAVYDYVMKLEQNQTQKSYYLIPELLNYTIRSHEPPSDQILREPSVPEQSLAVAPINPMVHWLCDLNITKICIYLQFLHDPSHSHLKPEHIKDIKLSMQVNGGVLLQQSKPEATWSPIDSRLTWSFSSLAELLTQSPDGRPQDEQQQQQLTTLMARFDLSDGPSTPSDVNIQFSLQDRTLSGTEIILESEKNFRISRQKMEVKTGIFRCEPPCL